MEAVLPYLFIAIGVFAILGAVLQWPFFMESRKAKRLTGVIGVTGARIFYAVLGVVIVTVGVVLVIVGPEALRKSRRGDAPSSDAPAGTTDAPETPVGPSDDGG